MANSISTPFLAFATDAKDIDTLKRFAETHNWPDGMVNQGDIRTATEFLKNNGSPGLLVVEIPSGMQAEIQPLLNALAQECSPDTKVIVLGTINEYSFYCWLMELGISSYLLKPLNDQMLETAYSKTTAQPAPVAVQAKKPGKVIAVLGTRGGVGSTTLAINLAAIIAEAGEQNTALVDIDPQKGSIALALDIEPSKGFREALERPDRMDALFIERAMHKHSKHLSILDSEETLHDRFTIHDLAGDMLLKELKDQYQVIVLDMPRHLNNYTRQCLGHAAQAVIVTELTLAGLRDTLRLWDMMRENYQSIESVIVANRVGMAVKHAVKDADFEKGINGKVQYRVSYAPDIFMPIGPDIASLKSKTHAAIKPLYALAAELLPDVQFQKAADKKKGGGGFFKRPPKEEKEAQEE
jgi:pilus assembly protein CpaE